MANALQSLDNLRQILELVAQRNALHANAIRQYLASCQDDFLALADSYLGRLARVYRPQGEGLAHLAECYLWVSAELFKEQIKFLRSGRYAHSSFAEVRQAVYDDRAYMDRYMAGLAVTQFLWRNHRDIFLFFQRHLTGAPGGRYLEIGPGHGLFLGEALAAGGFGLYTALDVSQASLDLCRGWVESLLGDGHPPLEYLCHDVTQFQPAEPYDFLAMGEVLEHVEEPERLMQLVHDLLRPGGRAFISTCANSPAVDHIYLFKDMDHIRQTLCAPGLVIDDELVLPQEGVDLEQAQKRRLSVNYCALLCRPAEARP